MDLFEFRRMKLYGPGTEQESVEFVPTEEKWEIKKDQDEGDEWLTTYLKGE